MADDTNDVTQDRPVASNSRSAKTQVDLFPAMNDRRAANIGPMRQHAPQRLGTQISLFSPVSFDEALDIVECLRGRAATTISLENMKKIDANRLVDFVAGASAALDGDFHKLSEQVYLFCPSNIKITVPAKAVETSTSAALSTFSGLNGGGALDFLFPNTNMEKSATASSWTSL